MGAWGYEALQSDCGLDVVNCIEDLYTGKYDMSLAEILSKLIKEDYISDDLDRIDFLYDNTAQAVAELVLMYKKDGNIRYDHEKPEVALNNKKSFTFDKVSLEFILQYLLDIKAEKPDEDDMRECVELWRESDSFEDWKRHLDTLIVGIEKEIASF